MCYEIGSRMCASILGMRANQLGASRILVRSCPVTLLAGITCIDLIDPGDPASHELLAGDDHSRRASAAVLGRL